MTVSRGLVTRRPIAGRRTPKAVHVAQRVVDDIASQGLAPGDALPNERLMLQAYNVARGTLREALRYLEFQGVVVMRTGPGGGPVVGTPTGRAVAQSLALSSHVARITYSDVLEARAILEPMLASRAATWATDDELDEIETSAERGASCLDDLDRFLDENEAFHLAIARAAKLPVLRDFLASLQWIIDAADLGVPSGASERSDVARAHERIVAALRTRDSAAAAAAMSEHLGQFLRTTSTVAAADASSVLRWDHLDL